MAKNYSHCPLKKRPVQIMEDISDEPENLSTKPEDLSRTGRLASVSPPSSYQGVSAFSMKIPSPQSRPLSSPSLLTPVVTLSTPPMFYSATEERLPYPPQISPDYAPQTWHRSVAPMYPPSYPYNPYHQQYDYMVISPSYSDSSLSPPLHIQQPLQPLALRPTVYSSIDQSSLSPSSSTTSPPPQNSGIPEDLSEKRRQGIRHHCPNCGKSYSTFSGLSKHQQFHCASIKGEKKTFDCKCCEKKYISLGALKMHIRTHTLPCKCSICGKAFSRPWLLQGHIRTHTGEKPFSCTHCKRAFADRSNLRAHLQTHSDEKKYRCGHCNKTFSRMSLLTKHAEGGCGGGNLIHSEKMY